jgi:hypothetical protein
MNTLPVSERASAANRRLQIDSQREPVKPGVAHQDFTRHAKPEPVVAVPLSGIPVCVGGGPLNSIASRTLHPGPEGFDTRPKPLEGAARAAHDAIYGRKLNDSEWAQSRARMLKFATILREWESGTPRVKSIPGNVEVLCQPEL